jgi:maleate isomerase
MTTPGRISPGSRAIGVIAPSSNRVVERVTIDVLRLFPDVDACFARIPYFGDGQGQPADGYDARPFLSASEQLAHARVDVICWNATRGAALGFAPDLALGDEIERLTGLPVVTTALAALDVLARFGAPRIALVTHGAPPQAAPVIANFRECGVETGAALHLGFSDNFAASRADLAGVAEFARACAAEGKADAILIWSTNLPGHAIAARLESEIDLPVLDSAAIGVWATLRALSIDTRPASSLGRLFSAL